MARLNFSHGSHEQKAELIRMVRQVSKEENKPICILADLQGPKIRTGLLKDHKPVMLVATTSTGVIKLGIGRIGADNPGTAEPSFSETLAEIIVPLARVGHT